MNCYCFLLRWAIACVLLYFQCNAAILKHKFKKEMDPQESSRRHYGRVYRIAYGCERMELVLSCEGHSDVRLPSVFRRHRLISVGHATYGRRTADVCYRDTIYDKNWSYPCSAPRKHTTSIVSRRCNGKQTCRIPVVNGLFGDPCPDTYKYLEVYYACDI